MKEAFLHYIWKYQKFLHKDLYTLGDHRVSIIHPGFHNFNAGPDFLEAKVQVDGIVWSGAVEIHINSSDWNLHKHSTDKAYAGVILHVVWKNDQEIYYPDGRKIPSIELENRIDLNLIGQFDALQGSLDLVACSDSWNAISYFTKRQMLENCLVERMLMKAEKASVYFQQQKENWEAATYYMVLSAFGFKINQNPFERLVHILPINLLRKYQDQLTSLQALIFGLSGFLDEKFTNTQKLQLQKEWEFLRHKHKLYNTIAKHEWKFLRLRPANFPTVRLAQLSVLIHRIPNLFQQFVQGIELRSLRESLSFQVPNIWYMEGEEIKMAKLGRQSIDHLILNISPPLLILYAKRLDNSTYMEKAFQILEKLPPENNKITRVYTNLKSEIKSAYDSQAFLQLYSSYCNPKQCLNCKIGLAIMKEAI